MIMTGMNKEISDIINEWDPIGLFPIAPKDEYYEEIKHIEEMLYGNAKITEAELAKRINEVFANSFGLDVYHKSIDDCIQVAKKIQKTLNNRF